MLDGYRLKMGAAIDYPASLSRPLTIGENSVKPKATSKVLRAVLIAAVLGVCLASGALDTLDKSRSTGATDCYTAMVNFHNAMMDYETTRISVFYSPPTCGDQCGGNSTCIDACLESRDDALEEKGLTLFSVSLLTCTPETVDQCAQARAMRDQCEAQYDPSQYSTVEEALAVWSQRSACVEASKVQFCE